MKSNKFTVMLSINKKIIFDENIIPNKSHDYFAKVDSIKIPNN